MLKIYLVSILVLSSNVCLFAAASDAVGGFVLSPSLEQKASSRGSRTDRSTELEARDIALSFPSEPKTPSRGSRLRGPAELSRFCLDVAHLGVLRSADYDAAQGHIGAELLHLRLSTPHSARTFDEVRKRLSDEVVRQKAILNGSSGGHISDDSSESSEEDLDGASTPLCSSTDTSRQEKMQQVLRELKIANSLLTQTAVRTQDGLERAQQDARANKIWAYIGTGLGFGGIIVSILFGVITFVPIH